jgi:type II secretory pathway pseudopilin PulG
MKTNSRAECPVASARLTLWANHPERLRPQRAFTRVELVAVVAVIGMLAVLAAPALSLHRADSERAVCFNNLRSLGRGVQAWAGDHNGQPPWWVPMADGGLRPAGGTRAGAIFFDYCWMSNELVTPKILVCPSDPGKKRARDFGQLFQPGFRAQALSYPVSLHASGDAPGSWLSGDGNIRLESGGSPCGTRITGLNFISPNSITSAWTNGALHGLQGHILLMDGTVEFTSTARFRELIRRTSTEFEGELHLLTR